MTTPIDRESVERTRQEILDHCKGHPYAEIPWPHRPLHTAADTLLALRAALDEVEAALDSAHAKVGSNIWRYWRDIAREQSTKRQEAEAQAAQEARAVALQEVATACDKWSDECGNWESGEAWAFGEAGSRILALLDTPPPSAYGKK